MNLSELQIFIHELVQGSSEWHRYRAVHFNASDASAMLGCSPYKTRDELLLQLHTGLDGEVDELTQARYDEGHRIEAMARPLGEDALMETLVPMVVSRGKYSASLDGSVPFPGPAIQFTSLWEHKQLNDALRAVMIEGATGADLPKHYRVQMEQQLMVTDADEVLFTASDWDGNTLIEVRHVTYVSDPELRAEIIAGWKLLEEELVSYVPPTGNAVVIARTYAAMPSLDFKVSGDLTIKHNLGIYHQALERFVASAPKKPSTDQEFADAESAGKKGREIAEVARTSKADLLRRCASMNEAMGVLDAIEKLGDDLGKTMEKVVKLRKEEVKAEMTRDARDELAAEVDSLNEGLGEALLPPVGPTVGEFAEAIKGKRNFDSMQSAVNDALAALKISYRQRAEVLGVNLKALKAVDAKHLHLFHDKAAILSKSPDDFAMLVSHRCGEYDRAEAARVEAEQTRIREAAEAAAKAERDAAINTRMESIKALGRVTQHTNSVVLRSNIATAHDMLILSAEYGERKEEAETLRNTVIEELRQLLAQAEAAEAKSEKDRTDAEALAQAAVSKAATTPPPAAPERTTSTAPASFYRAPAPAPTPSQASFVPESAPVDDGNRLNLGAINEHLKYMKVDAAQLSAMGFEPVASGKSGKQYRACDLPAIAAKLIEHLQTLTTEPAPF